MRVQPRYIDLTAVFLLAAILIGGGGWAYSQIEDTREKKLLAREVLSQHQSDMERVRKDLAGLRTILARQRQALARLSKRIPDTPEIGPLLSTVHGLVKGRDLILAGFSHEQPMAAGRYRRVAVQMNLEGGFLNLYDLIHELETLNRLFIIEALHMEKHEAEAGICTALISGSIFYNDG